MYITDRDERIVNARSQWLAEAKLQYREKCLRTVQVQSRYFKTLFHTEQRLDFDYWLIEKIHQDGVCRFAPYGGIGMSFEEFRDYLCPRKARAEWRYRTYGATWYALHGVGFRQRMPKKGSAAAKDRAPQGDSYVVDQDEARREHRRRGKARDRKRGWNWSRKWYGKWLSNRSHRAWEKRVLALGDYDELDARIRKDIFDPWIWD